VREQRELRDQLRRDVPHEGDDGGVLPDQRVGGLQETQIFANYQQVSATSASVTKTEGQPQTESVTCPSGDNLISASASVNQTANSGNGQAVLQGVTPSGTNGASAAAVTVGGAGASATYTLTVYGVCATV
jgi:hypothetical protein